MTFKRIIKRTACVIVWLILSWVNAGFLHASFHAEFPELFNRRHCRYDQSFSLGISLVPVTWVVTPFVTGFYADKWEWSCTGAPLYNKYGEDK